MKSHWLESHWLDTIISGLLPPTHREQVLGDLAERNADGSAWGYLADIITTLPALWRSHYQRGLRSSPRLADVTDCREVLLRERAETFQLKMWRRNWRDGAVSIFATLLCLANAATELNSDGPLPGLFMAGICLFLLTETVRFGGARQVPANADYRALTTFHAHELIRQREYLRRSSRNTAWMFVVIMMILVISAWPQYSVLIFQVGPFFALILTWGLLCIRAKIAGLQSELDELAVGSLPH